MGLEAFGIKTAGQQVGQATSQILDDIILAGKQKRGELTGEAAALIEKAKASVADIGADQLQLSTRQGGQAAKGKLKETLKSLPKKLVEGIRTLLIKWMPSSYVEKRIAGLTGKITQVYDDAAKRALSESELATYQTLRKEAIEQLKEGPKPALLAEGSEFKALADKVQKFVDETPTLSKQAYGLGDKLNRLLKTKAAKADAARANAAKADADKATKAARAKDANAEAAKAEPTEIEQTLANLV